MNQSRLIHPAPSNEEFGQHTRALRVAVGLDVGALANRAGLEPSLLERIEAGEAEPHLDLMVGIAFGLGMKPSTFFRLWESGCRVSFPDR